MALRPLRGRNAIRVWKPVVASTTMLRTVPAPQPPANGCHPSGMCDGSYRRTADIALKAAAFSFVTISALARTSVWYSSMARASLEGLLASRLSPEASGNVKPASVVRGVVRIFVPCGVARPSWPCSSWAGSPCRKFRTVPRPTLNSTINHNRLAGTEIYFRFDLADFQG